MTAAAAPTPAPARKDWLAWLKRPKTRARLMGFFGLSTAFSMGLGYGAWTRVCAAERCPSIVRLQPQGRGKMQQQTSKVYAADGRLITELGVERRTVVPLAEIPLVVRQAFIATEDKRFYSHNGIDYRRLPGAVLDQFRGFSTISQH